MSKVVQCDFCKKAAYSYYGFKVNDSGLLEKEMHICTTCFEKLGVMVGKYNPAKFLTLK